MYVVGTHQSNKESPIRAIKNRLANCISMNVKSQRSIDMPMLQDIYIAICTYRKIPKYLDTRKIKVIILKFESCYFTVE